MCLGKFRLTHPLIVLEISSAEAIVVIAPTGLTLSTTLVHLCLTWTRLTTHAIEAGV